jgi:DNA polymerase-4
LEKNGIDNNPVEPYTERKSIATEHTFVQDTIDMAHQSNFVWYGRKVGFSIAEEWLTSTVVVKIRYANFDTETKQCKIAYTSDHLLTQKRLI